MTHPAFHNNKRLITAINGLRQLTIREAFYPKSVPGYYTTRVYIVRIPGVLRLWHSATVLVSSWACLVPLAVLPLLLTGDPGYAPAQPCSAGHEAPAAGRRLPAPPGQLQQTAVAALAEAECWEVLDKQPNSMVVLQHQHQHATGLSQA